MRAIRRAFHTTPDQPASLGGWVRFRRTQPGPGRETYRVSRDRAGRRHIAFAVVPEPVPCPRTGEIIGVDRGAAVCLALSNGETYVSGPGAGPAHWPAGQAAVEGEAGQQPPPAGQGQARTGACPRRRPAERLGRESVNGHRAAVRRDPRREPENPEHDLVRSGHDRGAGRNVRQKAGGGDG